MFCGAVSIVGVLIFFSEVKNGPVDKECVTGSGGTGCGCGGGDGAWTNSPKGVSVGVLLISALISVRNCMSDQSTCPFMFTVRSALGTTGWAAENGSGVVGVYVGFGTGLTGFVEWPWLAWSGGVVIVFRRRVCWLRDDEGGGGRKLIVFLIGVLLVFLFLSFFLFPSFVAFFPLGLSF